VKRYVDWKKTTITNLAFPKFVKRSADWKNYSKDWPQSDIGSSVALVRFLDLIELEIESRVLGQVPGPCQLFDERQEFVVVAPVVVELDLPDELDLDALVFQTTRFPV